jgi:CheY-like chemotaxis protein
MIGCAHDRFVVFDHDDSVAEIGQAAEDGDQAYQILKEGAAVDIVFSDLVMPGKLNGYDLALKIAAEFPALKVLLTSGYASDVITKSLAQGQSYEILHKPYRQSVLADRLHALLDAQGD